MIIKLTGRITHALPTKRQIFTALTVMLTLCNIVTVHAQTRLLATNNVDSNSNFEPAYKNCSICHSAQYNQWRSSIMSYSSISPPIHALELSENHVMRPTLGRLARTKNAPIGSPHTENQLFCQKCHAPVAVFTDLFSNVKNTVNYDTTNRGSIPDSHSILRQIAGIDARSTSLLGTTNINSNDAKNATTALQEGVTCTVCHRINGQNSDNTSVQRNGFEKGIANSGYLIHHFTQKDKPINFGPFKLTELTQYNSAPHDVSESQNTILGRDGLNRRYIQTGEFCGSCHDVRINRADAGTNEVFSRVENLFTEWRNSPWNNSNNQPAINTTLVNALANPRETALNSSGNAIVGANNEKIKRITTCQDCHMSTYMLDPKSKPGIYEQGKVSSLSTEVRQISNHRFIGVDRFLVHDIPRTNNTGTNELKDFDISAINLNADGSATNSNFKDIQTAGLSQKNGQGDAREILLQKAIDFKVISASMANNGKLEVRVSVENIGAGHNIPAGLSQERQVWIELEVLNKFGNNVYTSGYLNPPETLGRRYTPNDSTRYKNSYCGLNNGEHEYECDLDAFRVKLSNSLEIEPGTFIIGDDANKRLSTGENLGLVNYQNGFTKNGSKVFSQFIADAINNNNALKPFVKNIEKYDIPVAASQGPFTVNARLRFRPLPHEFLEAISKNKIATSRVTDDVIRGNRVIEMAQDACLSSNIIADVRSCNPQTPFALNNSNGCAVHESGSLSCWGNNTNGQLGTGSTSSAKKVPTLAKGVEDVKMVALGGFHTCSLFQNGTVKCWGEGNVGQIGDGTIGQYNPGLNIKVYQSIIKPDPSAIPVISMPSRVKSIASGFEHSCALMDNVNKTVMCWGDGVQGALGDGNTLNHIAARPQTINSTSLSNVTQLSLGKRFGCALIESGEIKCWGNNASGQLGNNSQVSTGVPTKVIGFIYKATKIATGNNHTCALLENGAVYCWGNNAFGQLGIGRGSNTYSKTPQLVNLGNTAIDIGTGSEHSCALLADGNVKCWGLGSSGQLGDNNGSTSSTHITYNPTTVVSLTNVVSITVGGYGSCATLKTAVTKCWGSAFPAYNAYIPTTVDASILFEDAEDNILTSDLSNTGSEPWTRLSGFTPSPDTGPQGGVYSSRFYYYMETSNGHAFTNGNTSILETKLITFGSIANGQFIFDYHMYGRNTGNLFLDAYFNGSWNTLWEASGDKGNEWHHTAISMTNLKTSISNGTKVKFRIRAVAIGGYQGDIGIDNIKLTP